MLWYLAYSSLLLHHFTLSTSFTFKRFFFTIIVEVVLADRCGCKCSVGYFSHNPAGFLIQRGYEGFWSQEERLNLNFVLMLVVLALCCTCFRTTNKRRISLYWINFDFFYSYYYTRNAIFICTKKLSNTAIDIHSKITNISTNLQTNNTNMMIKEHEELGSKWLTITHTLPYWSTFLLKCIYIFHNIFNSLVIQREAHLRLTWKCYLIKRRCGEEKQRLVSASS